MNHSTGQPVAQGGFTLLELLIVMTVSIPILGSVMATNRMVREENTAREATADVAERCRTAGQRLALYGRAGLLSTCQIRATQDDVDTAAAAHATDPSVVLCDVGDWIAPYENTQRSTFSFQAADGVLSLNATALTPVREFEFVLEDGELDNGLDDDGDGLIDEGSLQLRVGTTNLELIAEGVEQCTFSLDGRVVSVHLQCAKRDHQGHVYRATSDFTIYMRNS